MVVFSFSLHSSISKLIYVHHFTTMLSQWFPADSCLRVLSYGLNLLIAPSKRHRRLLFPFIHFKIFTRSHYLHHQTWAQKLPFQYLPQSNHFVIIFTPITQPSNFKFPSLSCSHWYSCFCYPVSFSVLPRKRT